MGPRNQEVMLDFSGQLVDPDFTSSGKEEEARAGNDHKRWFQSAVWGFEEKRHHKEGPQAPTSSKLLALTVLASGASPNVRLRFGVDRVDNLSMDCATSRSYWKQADENFVSAQVAVLRVMVECNFSF